MPTKVHAIDIHVGHRLRERRLEAMLGLAALGQVVGVRAQQIQKYEDGKDRMADISRLFQLAAALGVPVSFFFAGLPKAVRTKASSTTLMQRRRNGRRPDPRGLKGNWKRGKP